MIRSVLLWPVKVGVVAPALWYVLRDPLPYPADWIVAIAAAILIHLSYAALMTGIRRGGDLRLLQKAGEPPADGARVALVGTVQVIGEPLRAPVSGTPCAGYTYEMFHYVQSRRQDGTAGSKRRVPDFSGIALAPSVIHTMQGDFPLLAYPFLSGFPEQTWHDEAHAQRAAAYVRQTTFEKKTAYVGELAALNRAMSATGGALKQDWRVTDSDEVAGLTFQEQCLPPGAKVCAFGVWSAAKGTLVSDPGSDSRTLLLVAGDVDQASQTLTSGVRSSRRLASGSFAVAAIVVGFILFAPWNAIRATPGGSLIIGKQVERLRNALVENDTMEIAAAIRYLDPNVAFEEASRTPLMWAKSVEAAEILVRHGASVAAHDANGYSVLMNAAERGSPELLRYLVAHGADVNERLKANAATTALSIARSNNTPAAVAALIAAGARE